MVAVEVEVQEKETIPDSNSESFSLTRETSVDPEAVLLPDDLVCVGGVCSIASPRRARLSLETDSGVRSLFVVPGIDTTVCHVRTFSLSGLDTSCPLESPEKKGKTPHPPKRMARFKRKIKQALLKRSRSAFSQSSEDLGSLKTSSTDLLQVSSGGSEVESLTRSGSFWGQSSSRRAKSEQAEPKSKRAHSLRRKETFIINRQ